MTDATSTQESKPVAWPLVAAWITLAAVGLRTVSQAGIWMHLASGRWISQNGIPRQDPFTFTRAGEPWMDGTWLYDLFAFAMHQLGMPALILVHVAAVVFAFVLLARVARPVAGPVATGLAILLSAWILLPIFRPAPEIFSLVFPAAFLALLSRPRLTGTAVAGLVGLQVLWANCSPSCVLGMVLCLLFALGHTYRARTDDTTTSADPGRYVLAAGLAAAACCLTPYGPATLRAGVADFLGVQPQIAPEWVSSFAGSVHAPFVRHLTTLTLGIGVGGLLTYRGKLPLGLTLCAILGLLCTYSTRHLGLFALLACPFVALSLSALGERMRTALPFLTSRQATAAGAGLLSAVCAFTLFSVTTNRTSSWLGGVSTFGLGLETAQLPSGALPVLASLGTDARVVHHPLHAGYLLWQQPDRRVMTDSRFAFHGREQILEMERFLNGQPEAVNAILSRNDAEALLLHLSWPGSSRLYLGLVTTGFWKLAYFDGTSAVLLPTSSQVDSADYAQSGLDQLEASRRQVAAAVKDKRFSPEAARLVGAGELFHGLQQWKKSAAAHELVLATYPGFAEGWFRLAHAQLQLGNPEPALISISHAVALLPKEPSVLRCAAEAHRTLGQSLQADQLEARAAAADPR